MTQLSRLAGAGPGWRKAHESQANSLGQEDGHNCREADQLACQGQPWALGLQESERCLLFEEYLLCLGTQEAPGGVKFLVQDHPRMQGGWLG